MPNGAIWVITGERCGRGNNKSKHFLSGYCGPGDLHALSPLQRPHFSDGETKVAAIGKVCSLDHQLASTSTGIGTTADWLQDLCSLSCRSMSGKCRHVQMISSGEYSFAAAASLLASLSPLLPGTWFLVPKAFWEANPEL